MTNTQQHKTIDYAKSLKSSDTEEGIDLAFYRPIGYAWARISMKLGITPNVLTVIGIIIGLSAAGLFYPNVLWINACGMLLLVLANTFDSADGQLARLTHQYSRTGRILDGLCGDLWFGAIYIAICFREMHYSEFFGAHPLLIWILAIVTGICHAKQASMADYYRQFHLYMLKGQAGSELENCDELRARLRKMSWKKQFFAKLALYVYANYTANQEVMTPSMQQLRRSLRKRYRDADLPRSFCSRFRALSLPLMKYTNILSFNWRVIVLFVSLLAGQPWLYFVAELTLGNALLVYMMYRHEKICKLFSEELKNEK